MTGFVALALLLLALALGLLAWPLLRRTAASPAELSSRQLTAAVYRDKLAELDQDLAAGSLSQADYEHSRNELQRRLLEDSAEGAATGPAAASAAPRSKGLTVALATLLPVAAIGLYMVLGTPAALDETNPHGQRFSQSDIEKMVGELAARLETQPDDHRGWAMLGRSYKMMGRFDDAAKAYARTGPMLETSAELLVDYADSVAAAVDRFDEKSLALLDRALKLEPDNAQGLWMRGSAAFEAGRFAAAITDWERLQALLPPDSDDARTIAGNLAEARRRAGAAPVEKAAVGTAPGPVAAAASSAATAAAPRAGHIEGRVELAPELAARVAAGDMLMVVARPADGNRLPAAVLRVPAAGFPAAFRLDDSQAMTADRKLSAFQDVLLEARVSRKGQARVEPGDLVGEGVPVKVGSSGVVLRIERIVQ